MRKRLRLQSAVLAAACFVALPALAQQPEAGPLTYSETAPVVGGLSLVPERWRYRPGPRPAPLAGSGALSTAPETSRLHASAGLRTLESVYVPDRSSFINTLRARRGLSLLTLWEGAGRCLFFGVNERGRAGINLVSVRHAERSREAPNTTQRLYAELTGQPRATFPDPPRLFPH